MEFISQDGQGNVDSSTGDPRETDTQGRGKKQTPTTDPHATEHTTSRGRLYKHHYATKVNAYTMHSCTHVHTVPTQ